MNSVIISFILNFIKICQLSFETSIFNKFQNKIKNLWLSLTKTSKITKWFSTYPKDKNITKTSIVFNIFKNIFNIVAKPFLWLKKILNKSCIITAINEWYKTLLTKSIRGYSCLLLSFITSFSSILFIKNALTNRMFFISLIILIISIIGIFINKSISVLFLNSKVFKLILNIFDLNLTNKNTETCSRKYLITHICIGLICGMFSTSTKTIILPLLILGLLGGTIILTEYRIGIFSAIILFPFLPTMAVVGMILISLVSFIFKLITDENFKYKKTPLDIPIVIFTIIMLISTISSFAMTNSIKVFLVYFTFVASYYLIVNSINTKTQLMTLIQGIIFAGIIVSLYGIYQYIFGFAEGTIWTDNEMFDIKTRVVSTFENPNVLGEYLLLLLPISAGYIFSKKSIYSKSSNLIATGLLGLCMIFTYSRGNWVGLIVAIALFFAFYDRKIIWLGILAALFIPAFIPDSILDRFMSIGNQADTSTSYRVHIWFGTLRLLKDYWLTGIGLGSEAFKTVYQHYSYAGVIAPHSHNLYLQIIAENGVFGLITFASIILLYYKMSISTIINNKNDKLMKSTITGLSAGLFGYLVQGLFDNVWYNYRIVFMFFLILALTSSAILICRKENCFGNS